MSTTEQNLQPTAFEPQTVAEASTLAKMLASSSLIPDALRNKPGDVLVVLMTGRELGLAPMQALREINVIKGKGVASADLMAGLVCASPVCEYFRVVEATDSIATVETKRVGWPDAQRISYTVDDAKHAGLLGKDNWTKNCSSMLIARVKTRGARTWYPDVVGGFYSPDEADEIIGNRNGKAAPVRHVGGVCADAEVVETVVGPSTGNAPQRKDTVSEILAAQKRLEAIIGADGRKEVWKRVCKEAGVTKGVRLYTTKDKPLAEEERLATQPELIAILAGLNHAINQQEPPQTSGAFLTDEEARQLDEKIASVAKASDVDPETITALALRAHHIARRADVTSDAVPTLLAWLDDYDPIVDGDSMPKEPANA